LKEKYIRIKKELENKKMEKIERKYKILCKYLSKNLRCKIKRVLFTPNLKKQAEIS